MIINIKTTTSPPIPSIKKVARVVFTDSLKKNLKGNHKKWVSGALFLWFDHTVNILNECLNVILLLCMTSKNKEFAKYKK